MPNAGIHLLIAGRILRRWAAAGAEPPFPAADPSCARAFRYGAVAPDAGYFPPTDRFFSELAHLTRSGELARAMVEEAETAAQRAHAWGWVAHLLGDLAIHPLINAAHGEWLWGDRSRPVTSTEDEVGHMRLEHGLDAAVYGRFPEIQRVVIGRCPDGSCLAHVRRAFFRVHGWAPSDEWTAAAHRRCGRMARLALFVNRVHTAPAGRRPFHAALRGAAGWIAPPRRGLPGAWNRSAAAALLSPRPPPGWLVSEVSETVDRLADRLDALRHGELGDLGNFDLVSGAAELAGSPTARVTAVRQELERRRDGGRAPTPAPA